LPVLRSRNSACKHARYSSVLYIAKSRGFPGNFAELIIAALNSVFLGKIKCYFSGYPTSYFLFQGGWYSVHTLAYTVPLPSRRPPYPLNFIGRQPDTHTAIYW
jgi:hypothetical protein